jgi:ubiquinone/menaquinone biosynthesis C-methylase UbiE
MEKQAGLSKTNRRKDEARNYYDHISRYYDWIGGLFERKPAIKALEYLQIHNGETVLEIGFGTGYCLHKITDRVGQTGHVYGMDISQGMIWKTRKRLAKASLRKLVNLCQGDAVKLPFGDRVFDTVYLSFTLELFDNSEIPDVLDEIKRVLKTNGKLGIVSLSKTESRQFVIEAYEWAHHKWPKYIDCRPIYVASTIQKAGYKILLRNAFRLVILPIEIIIATKE